MIADVTRSLFRICGLLIVTIAAAARNQTMGPHMTYTSDITISSKSFPQDFSLDGNLSKTAWREASWLDFDHDMAGTRHYPEAKTRVASRWTSTHVYFAFECHYSTLNTYEGEDVAKERWELWNRDVAEVFLNPEPERVPHYYEFEVAPNNQWIDLEIDKTKTPFNDAAWDSHFEHATRIDSKNRVWACEMRIPFSPMKSAAPRAGAEWRVNFFRADGPGDSSRRRFLAWSPIPEGKTFHVPERFGVLRFTN